MKIPNLRFVCSECGRTGKGKYFLSRTLCRKCAPKKRNLRENPLVEIDDGLVTTARVRSKLHRDAERTVGFILTDWLARIIPITIVGVGVYFMMVTDGGWIALSLFGSFFLAAAVFHFLDLPHHRKVNLKIVELAHKRKKELDEQRRFYNSAEWRQMREAVQKEESNICHSCGRKISHKGDLTVDHIKPRSKFPELALDKSNLTILCRRCNAAKGARFE